MIERRAAVIACVDLNFHNINCFFECEEDRMEVDFYYACCNLWLDNLDRLHFITLLL